MFRLQDITFIHVRQTEKGIFTAAKYRDWFNEYNFFIYDDGKITGRTSSDSWCELSQESANIVKAKLRNFMAAEPLYS